MIKIYVPVPPPAPMDAVADAPSDVPPQYEVVYQYVFVRHYGFHRRPIYSTDPNAAPWVLDGRVVTTPAGRRVRVIYKSAAEPGAADIEFRPLDNKQRYSSNKRYWVRRVNVRYWSFLRALDGEIEARENPRENPYRGVNGIAKASHDRSMARIVGAQIAQRAGPDPDLPADPDPGILDGPDYLEGDVPRVKVQEFWSQTLLSPETLLTALHGAAEGGALSTNPTTPQPHPNLTKENP